MEFRNSPQYCSSIKMIAAYGLLLSECAPRVPRREGKQMDPYDLTLSSSWWEAVNQKLTVSFSAASHTTPLFFLKIYVLVLFRYLINYCTCECVTVRVCARYVSAAWISPSASLICKGKLQRDCNFSQPPWWFLTWCFRIILNRLPLRIHSRDHYLLSANSVP